METFAFIGSDKNAGKTTALLNIYDKLLLDKKSVCLASTGINGEAVDTFFGHAKPEIQVRANSYFISTAEHGAVSPTSFDILDRLNGPEFSKPYLLCKCTKDFRLILEGPNTRGQIEAMQHLIRNRIPEVTLLIDGSVDRQFLGQPTICDGFYFSILITDRAAQMQQARRLLQPLSFPRADSKTRAAIGRHKQPRTKSIVLDQQLIPRYCGDHIPFLDEQLLSAVKKMPARQTTLYLNGALPRSLSEHLAGMKNLRIVLDNFTLFQTISGLPAKRFLPEITLLQEVKVLGIYLRYETKNYQLKEELNLPENIPVVDLSETTP